MDPVCCYENTETDKMSAGTEEGKKKWDFSRSAVWPSKTRFRHPFDDPSSLKILGEEGSTDKDNGGEDYDF